MSGSSNLDIFRDGWLVAVQLLFSGVLPIGLDTARSILVELPSNFFSIRLISLNIVHPYSSIDTTVALKELRFITSVRFDFHMTDNYR